MAVNAAIAEYALREKYLAEKHVCNNNCTGCRQRVTDSVDRLWWTTSQGPWDKTPRLPPPEGKKKDGGGDLDLGKIDLNPPDPLAPYGLIS